MDRYKFTLLGIGLAVVYWFAESVIHRFVYADEFLEVVPSDINEFWMRLSMVLLIVAFGAFADNRARRIAASEREKREVFIATVRSTQHILNNLMNQLQLMFFDLEKEHCLESETRKLLERSIREGKEQVERLSSVSDISGESIEESVRPQ
ncbi:MAG: hypothetical protein GWP60_12045 [Gammaproteobacteria bacterium]|jgi:hypothetical protein|nr:hypothetical protein [Gammaproteobacteria bacterium]